MNKQKRNNPTFWIILLILSIIISFITGGVISSRNQNSQIEKQAQYSYNQGYNECRDNWIDYSIGVKDSCHYETNENNSMYRYTCGELSSRWMNIQGEQK